jgi:hypothetical protein
MKSVDCERRQEGARAQVIIVEREVGASCHVQTAQLFTEFIAEGSKI